MVQHSCHQAALSLYEGNQIIQEIYQYHLWPLKIILAKLEPLSLLALKIISGNSKLALLWNSNYFNSEIETPYFALSASEIKLKLNKGLMTVCCSLT